MILLNKKKQGGLCVKSTAYPPIGLLSEALRGLQQQVNNLFYSIIVKYYGYEYA
jgi:hypothetical protein